MKLPLKAQIILHQNVFLLPSICDGKKLVWQSCSMSTFICETFFPLFCLFYSFITCWEKQVPVRAAVALLRLVQTISTA